MGNFRKTASGHLLFLILCFIGLSNSSHAWQKENNKLLADQYFQKAKQLGDASQFDSSIYYYQKALKVYEMNKDWRGFVKSHIGLGACYTWLSRFDMANDYLMNGLKTGIDSLGKMDSVVAETYEAMGFYHGRSGDFEKQLLAHQEALNIGIKVLGTDHPKVAEYYSNYGTSYGNKGNYVKSIVNLKKGLDIRSKRKSDPTGLFQSYNNLGAIYLKKGDYNKTLTFVQKGLSFIHEDSTKKIEVAISYNNIGRTFEAIGNVDLAFSYMEKALDSFVATLGENHYYAGILMNNMGSLLLKKEDYDNGLIFFSKAQNIFQNQGSNHPYVALTHVNMAKCYDKKDQSAEALKHLEMALSLQKKILNPDHPDMAITLNNLGIHYFQENNHTNALQYFQEALTTLIPEFEDADFYVNPSLKENINSKMVLLQILQHKGKALEGLYLQNDNNMTLEHALNTYQVAIQLIDTIRFGFSSEESQKELTENSFSVYEGAIQVAHKLYDIDQEEKYLVQAFDFSQKSKAFLLLQAIKKAEGLRFAGVPDSLIDQERDLKINVSFYDRELHLAKQRKDSLQTSLYQNYLFQFTSELDILNRRLEEDYPKYYQLKYNHRLPMVSDIQHSLLNKETVLLDYFVGDSTINILCVSKDKLNIFAYHKPANFESLVKDFKKSTEDWQFINNHPVESDELYVNSASQLYQLLLGEPLESIKNPVQKLIIIPGGILGYVNFEAFLSRRPSNLNQFSYNDLDYLVKSYDVQYLYSAASYLNGKETVSVPYSRNTGKFGGFAVEDISLPGTVFEVNRIAGTVGGDTYTGIHATERNFKAKAIDYPVLHLSMHAYLDDINPLYSKFVFTQSKDTVEDDSLTIAEIYNMRFNTQLAVLSACETGDGVLSRGEGIMSLSRAFAYAGCPSVVTSLWKVDSETTSTLMLDFYQNLIHGLPKDRSLRLAKLNYLKSTEDPLRAHPHFWLSFIVIGDTAPLNFWERYNWWLGLAFLVGFIFVGLIFWKNRMQGNSYP
ncbi:MAG: CHAT domain-containing tetratricopeptide repeat protein [Anditalea sp.]